MYTDFVEYFQNIYIIIKFVTDFKELSNLILPYHEKNII